MSEKTTNSYNNCFLLGYLPIFLFLSKAPRCILNFRKNLLNILLNIIDTRYYNIMLNNEDDGSLSPVLFTPASTKSRKSQGYYYFFSFTINLLTLTSLNTIQKVLFLFLVNSKESWSTGSLHNNKSLLMSQLWYVILWNLVISLILNPYHPFLTIF